ncbi:MAG TPA: hypothetical protein VGR57_08725 [Ktedonobacterales bacterium]|nr:hypothetical protein [Ktedonobacterales bacterium]
MPQAFQHRVAYIDYHGRISEEGQETAIANERRTTFVRRYLDGLGHDGWELVGIQPVSPHAAYYVFKRPADPASPYVPLERQSAANAGAPPAD